MKKMFLAIAIVFSMSMVAQEKEEKEVKLKKVPTAVMTAFKSEFPNTKATWGNEDGGYEAEFKMNGSDASAVYDKQGHRKELEVAIKTKQLPANVLEYLNKNYATSKITEAAKITDDKNTVTFEAEISKDGKKYDVLFDVNGKFIKTGKGD